MSSHPMDFTSHCRICDDETPHVVFTRAFMGKSFGNHVICKLCETLTPLEMFNIWKVVMEIECEL